MDQADSLREMVRSKTHKINIVKQCEEASVETSPLRVISVTSGKGGVGKTNIVGNLAISFRRLGQRVLILDGDLGLANIDIIFGLNTVYNIKHVVSGEKSLADIMVEGPEEICIIPAGSGVQELAHLTNGQKLNLLSEFDMLNEEFDILLIDTGAGISSNIIYFNMASQERLVVVTCEPSSITDAYALMKVMSTQHGTKSFKLVVNMAGDAEEARAVFENLSNAVGRFLKDISLGYVGFIPVDDNFQKAVRQQCTVLQRYPESESSRGFHELAKRLLSSSASTPSDGNIKFFWKKLMNCQ
jgi:flagellar biosynthesis protein FlhG